MVATESDLLRWIPLLPLLAAVIHGVMLGLVRRSLARSAVILLSCGSVVLAFVISFVAFLQLLGLSSAPPSLRDPRASRRK